MQAFQTNKCHPQIAAAQKQAVKRIIAAVIHRDEPCMQHTADTYYIVLYGAIKIRHLPSCAISHSQQSWLPVPGPAHLTPPGETHLKPPEQLFVRGNMYLDHLSYRQCM